jgi:hypothetical protein
MPSAVTSGRRLKVKKPCSSMEVTPWSEARIMFATSLLTTTSCAASAYLGIWDCLFTSSAILFCSVNYWRKAEYGWRRNVDIVNTLTCLAYQLYICPSIELTLRAYYLFFTTLAMAGFVFGQRLPGRAATLAHSSGHVFGNIANMFLYKGFVNLRIENEKELARVSTLPDKVIGSVLLLTLIDIMFIGGWPPRWWPPADYPEDS